MKILSFVAVALLGISAFASEDVEIRIPPKGANLVKKSFYSKVGDICFGVNHHSYTKGKIYCSSEEAPQTDSPVTILIDEEKEIWSVTATFKDHPELSAGWKLKKDQKAPLEALSDAGTIINRYLFTLQNRRFVEELAITEFLKTGNTGLELNEDGQYIEAQTREVLTTEEAKDYYISNHSKFKSFMLATMNVSIVLGLNMAQYMRAVDFNAVDWDYEPNWSGFRKKLLDGPIFDDNGFDTNAFWHPVGGYVFHAGTRIHGFSFYESFLFGFVASTMWEYVFEIKEIASLNDIIVTPIAGSIIGEVGHQLSQFLLSSPSLAKKIVGSVIDPVGTLNRLLFGIRTRQAQNIGKYGLNADVFSKFRFYGGYIPNKELYYFNVQTNIYKIKNYLAEGYQRKKFKTGDISMMEIDAQFGDKVNGKLRMLFEVALAGVQKQKIVSEADQKQGYSVLVGLTSGYEYRKEYQASIRDDIALVNVVGGMLEFHYFYKGIHFTTQSKIHGNFASIRSQGWEKMKATYVGDTKSVLETYDYYMAYGITAANKSAISYHRFKLENEVSFAATRSIDHQNRDIGEPMTDNFSLADQRLRVKTSLRMRIYKNFVAGIAHAYYRSSGRAKDTFDSKDDHVFFGEAGLEF